jgi:hypothetical protein
MLGMSMARDATSFATPFWQAFGRFRERGDGIHEASTRHIKRVHGATAEVARGSTVKRYDISSSVFEPMAVHF